MSANEVIGSQRLVFSNAKSLRCHGSTTTIGIIRYRYDFVLRHVNCTIARYFVTGIIFYRVGKSIISRCRNIKIAGNRNIAGYIAIMVVDGAYAIHRTE